MMSFHHVVKFTHRPSEQIDSTVALASEACWLGFPYLKDFSLSGFPLPKELRRGRTVANPHLFPWVFDSSLDRASHHVHRLGSIDLLLSIVHNLHCFIFPLPLHLPLAYSIARRGLFQVAVTRRKILLTHILLEVSDHHLLKPGVVSRFSFLNTLLSVQRRQWLLLF